MWRILLTSLLFQGICLATEMSLKRIVNVSSLAQLVRWSMDTDFKWFLRNSNTDFKDKTQNLKILDCTYVVGKKPDPDQWKVEWYGKFDELRNRSTQQKLVYLSDHIPGAIHADLDACMYPSRTERFSMYEPHIFEQYAQILGLNNEDHLIFYGRGPFGGMLFAARFYWLFRSYGHKRLAVLDGGLNAWKAAGQSTEMIENYPDLPRGTWKATGSTDQFVIPFEDLDKAGGPFDNPAKFNLLDARIRPQYEGKQDTGLDPEKVSGSRIRNTTNVPAIEFINTDGVLKTVKQIETELFPKSDPNFPTIVFCNTGLQASMVALLHDVIFPNRQVRLYNGGLTEMAQRNPKRISDGPIHVGQ